MTPSAGVNFLSKLFLFIGAAGFSNAASLIYNHGFSGTGSLDGGNLDVASGTLGGTAGASWQAAAVFGANGDVGVVGGINRASAYVPFNPVDGYLYTISITSTITSGADNNSWFAIGLLNGTPNTTGTFNYSGTGDGQIDGKTFANFGHRNASGGGTTNLLRWGGLGTSQSLGSDQHVRVNDAGPWTLSILLDTSVVDAWKFTLQMTAGGNTYTSSSYDLGNANSEVSHIMLQTHRNAASTIDNFSVTADAIPEPSSALICAMAAAGVLALRRRQ